MILRICHLYPDIMNIYGDRGNIIALKNRCYWRGIKVNIKNISLNDKFDPRRFDLFFGGGGQDRQQRLVAKDLQRKEKQIRKAAEENKVFLLICGTYQLFGHYFKTASGEKMPGIGILDIITIASNKRKIGNVIVKINKSLITNYLPADATALRAGQLPTTNLVGFENHSGNTYLTKNYQLKVINITFPLGKVVRGFGNNGMDKTEGAVYKNVFGTYLHGSLLPKNPHFADLLIKLALENRYKRKVELKPLDDTLERQAHEYAKKLR